MNQTQWIAGSIFIGFLVFITIRGELPAYQSAIFGKPQQTGASK